LAALYPKFFWAAGLQRRRKLTVFHMLIVLQQDGNADDIGPDICDEGIGGGNELI
jgi:hypothetical protein